MASFSITGLDELAAALRESSDIPDDVKKKALTEMGNIHAKKQKDVGESMNVRDPESDVHILDKIKVNAPKLDESGGSVTVTFSGSRKRGDTTTRNAEIAFVNEFGKRGVTPRPFVATANEAVADKSSEAGMDIIHEWLKKTLEN